MARFPQLDRLVRERNDDDDWYYHGWGKGPRYGVKWRQPPQPKPSSETPLDKIYPSEDT